MIQTKSLSDSENFTPKIQIQSIYSGTVTWHPTKPIGYETYPYVDRVASSKSYIVTLLHCYIVTFYVFI